MKASIVIATYRPAGAVAPLRGLTRQTFGDFEVVIASEVFSRAWETAPYVCAMRALAPHPISYHAPTLGLNRGIDAALGEVVVLLTDFAFPEPEWLETLIATLEATGAAAVGGMKCSHGVADQHICTPRGCDPQRFLPLGLIQGLEQTGKDVAVVHPFQASFTLGNLAFRRSDAQAVNGLDDRFAGGHGFEDENFVRRLVAYTRKHAVLTRKAVVHHYWPYSSGYKPVFRGKSNAVLSRVIDESEILIGDLQAKRGHVHGKHELVERPTPVPPPEEP